MRSSAESTAPAATPTTTHAPTLPSPPTDAERDSYFERRLGPMTLCSVVGMAGLLVSGVKFAIASPYFVAYLAFMAMTLAYFLISLRVNSFTRDLSLDDHREKVESWAPAHFPSVDVLLPVAGESHRILHNTWSSVAALDYPGEVNVYVLDDADDPVAQLMAGEFDFDYTVRENRGWFKKAGNLRHGYERSGGDFIVILDADFCPRADFLQELLPYFDDETVGLVQSPQYFRVLDSQGWLERGAGAVQEFFYRAIQVSRGKRDAAICVGTNAVYRRAALDATGGTTLIEHSEDVHTGFNIRKAGWDLLYVPTCVAAGVCPDELPSFFRQQYRWCMGSMSLLGSAAFWRTRMALRSRLCYVSGFLYYIYTALLNVVGPLVPLVLLFAAPEMVEFDNYAMVAPALVYGFVLFPLWHRCSYGLEAWTVRMVYGWAHAFAIVDLLRRRPMGWTATGVTKRKDHRVATFRSLIGVWSAGTAVLWVGAAAWHSVLDRVDFLPMLALGLFQLVIALRAFTSTEGRGELVSMGSEAIVLADAEPAMAAA